MSNQLILEFKPANEKQKEFIESAKKFLLLSGAVGAGKSFLGCWKGFILNLVYPGNSGLICRKEMTSLKTSTMITLLEQVIPQEMIVKMDKIDGYLIHKTPVPGVHSKISFSGLDKKADQQYPTKIGSTEYGWIFADETAELTEDDFQVLATRLRYKITIDNFNKIKKHYGLKISYKQYVDVMVRQLFGATNPDGPTHYLYKFFFESSDDDRKVWKATPYDNPYLDKDYLKMLEATLSGIRRQRLLNGEWVQAEGVIYDTFSYETNVINIDLVEEINTYKQFFGGADSNFPLPRAGVIFGVKGDGNIDIIDEYYQEGSHPEDLAQWFSDFATHFGIYINVFHDPADPDAIDKIDKYPNINCEKGNNKVLPGIDSVHKHITAGSLRINRKCVNSIKFLQMYKWKTGALQQPLKEHDHLPDAIRYGLFSFETEGGMDVDEFSAPVFI